MFAAIGNMPFSKGREEFSLTEGRITNMGIGNKIRILNPISFGDTYLIVII